MRFSVPMMVSVDVGPPDPTEASKQRSRLFQAGLVGPLMVYGGAKTGGFLGFSLCVLGIHRSWHSGRQYLAARAPSLTAPAVSPVSPENLPSATPSA